MRFNCKDTKVSLSSKREESALPSMYAFVASDGRPNVGAKAAATPAPATNRRVDKNFIVVFVYDYDSWANFERREKEQKVPKIRVSLMGSLTSTRALIKFPATSASAGCPTFSCVVAVTALLSLTCTGSTGLLRKCKFVVSGHKTRLYPTATMFG